MTKITNKMALAIALESLEVAEEKGLLELAPELDGGLEEVKGKLNKMIEQLDKKASSPKKPSKNQVANQELKEQVFSALKAEEHGVTISELIGAHEELSGYTTQKISPLMSQLVKEGRVDKEVLKGRSYFSVTWG